MLKCICDQEFLTSYERDMHIYSGHTEDAKVIIPCQSNVCKKIFKCIHVMEEHYTNEHVFHATASAAVAAAITTTAATTLTVAATARTTTTAATAAATASAAATATATTTNEHCRPTFPRILEKCRLRDLYTKK